MATTTTNITSDLPKKEEAGMIDIDESTGESDDLDFSVEDEKRLIRKLDLRLIPWLSLLYLLSFLDRTSIGNA